MAIFKCKMCGGALDVHDNETVAVCEYCGSKQTVPTRSSEVITNLFNRANNLRLKNEFDKAAEIYGKILDEDDANSEAHWCLLLCKYGIEYVEDPKTYKRIPTCHRAQYTSVLTDPDYTAAVANADAVSKEVYTEQAHEISELQKSILAIVKNEKPFDVFICYKESDENGKRTVDSALANDIYYQLTKEGLRVFYAAITLEDKLGQEYEPYIFAALNTAKVMLVIGTKPEYFEAVWVRNEWSRFLAMMKTDRDKMLIPCYRDMDAYELPEEFAHLQAQDMAKIGFINDLVRGIKKVTAKEENKPEPQTVIQQVGAAGNMQALLKRGYMALEDGEWDRADSFFEEVLNLDAECAEAYLGQLLAKNKLTSLDDYTKQCFDIFCDDVMGKRETVTLTVPEDVIRDAVEKYSIPNYFSPNEIRKQYRSIAIKYNVYYDTTGQQVSDLKNTWKNSNLLSKAKRFAKGEFADVLAKAERELFEKVESFLATIKAEDEKAVKNGKEKLSAELAVMQSKTGEYYNSQLKRRETDYADWCKKSETAETISELNALLEKFVLFEGYKDSEKKAEEIRKRIEKKEEEEKARKKAEEEKKRLEAERQKKERNKKILIGSSFVAVAVAVVILIVTVIIPSTKYNKAIELMDAGNVVEAYEALVALDGYKDSADKANAIYAQYNVVKLKFAKAGDYVFFGAYEQDNNTSNGKEDVEWLVLEVKDGKALVISKYALDCKPYNTSYTDVTWETCTLRKWLNNDFLGSAFSADEKAMIPTVTVHAYKNPNYNTNPGNATQDQVFLLSITEAEKYFSSDSARQCKPTDYAVANGAWESDSGNCWWCLRSPGIDQGNAAIVLDNGNVRESGFDVDNYDFAVRPAMWIDLS